MEKFSYTITREEFKMRQEFIWFSLFSFVITVLVTTFLSSYNPLWIIIVGIITLIIIGLLIIFFTHRRFKYNETIELNEIGIMVTRGEKMKKYLWSDFDRYRTFSEEAKAMARAGSSEPPRTKESKLEKLWKETEQAHGGIFMLRFRKQGFLQMSPYFKLYAEPGIENKVEEFLKEYIKK